MTPHDLVPAPRRVLAVCAHPDDESFGLGAVISTLIDQGASIDLVCLTQGEASTLGSSAIDLAQARRGELAAAANELGITTVHQFDHPDGRLSSVDLVVLTAAVQPLANPIDLLLVFDEGGVTGHPDHIHATAAAMAVADVLDLPVLAWTLDLRVADTLNTEFNARFVGRAESEIHVRLPVDRRRQHAAMRCHDSQFTGNPVPDRRIALTGDTEPLRFLRRAHPTTHDTKDRTQSETRPEQRRRRPLMSSNTTQTVLVVGGGIGGIATANRLRRRLDRRHRVVLINRDPDFTFAASYLWVMTGDRRPDQITRPLRRLERRGIEVIIGEVTDINPTTRTVTVGDQRLTGDHLVVALGADWATDRIPGLVEHGHTFATLTGAQQLADQLLRVQSGRIVVVTAAPLYKCPAAPYEAALLIDAGLRARGIRDRVEVSVRSAEPAPMPVAGANVSAAVASLLAERDIDYQPGRQITSLEHGSLQFGDTSEPIDLVVYMPPITPPPVIANSALAADDGWIHADPTTLTTAFPGVYAIGDNTHIVLGIGKPLPRAGVFAHGQAHAVADTISAAISGNPQSNRFDGHGGCFIETGSGRAAYGAGNFYADPAPTVVLHKPARRWHWGKAAFEQQVMRRWL